MGPIVLFNTFAVEASWLDPHNEFRRKHIDTPDLVVDQEVLNIFLPIKLGNLTTDKLLLY